jgi:hypothetical protein
MKTKTDKCKCGCWNCPHDYNLDHSCAESWRNMKKILELREFDPTDEIERELYEWFKKEKIIDEEGVTVGNVKLIVEIIKEYEK